MTELSRTHQLRVVEASHGWVPIDWVELWRYRELIYFLAWRDVKIRYKQTALGALWAILQPLSAMVVFSIFFGKVIGLEGRTGGVPYAIYVYAGLLPWLFFAHAITSSGRSLIGSSSLITKVSFPRLAVPLAAAASGLVDLAVGLGFIAVLMIHYDVMPTWRVLILPALVAVLFLVAAGAGTLLSALTVEYRDVHHVVPFAVQLLLFLTPVIYPLSMVPDQWRWAATLNPLAGVIEGFRSALLGQPLDWSALTPSFITAVALFLLGATYFRQVERRLADVI